MSVESAKACVVCSHPARASVDGRLRSGGSPRALAKLYPGLTRLHITRHRDEGHHRTPPTQRSEHYARGGTAEDWASCENRPPPEDAELLRVVVRDDEGLSCDTAVWPLRMLGKLDASVWAEHEQAGSIHLIERGERTAVSAELWARFDRGEALTLAATGPDADEALEGVREMLEAPPDDHKEIYRRSYLNTERRREHTNDERRTT